MTTDNLITFVLPPIFGAIGWFANHYTGRAKRNNDFIADLQQSIDLLTEKYTDALANIVKLREENVKLIAGQQELQKEVKALRLENAELKAEIETRLANKK